MFRGSRLVLVTALASAASAAAYAQERDDGGVEASRTVVACVAREADYVRGSAPAGPDGNAPALLLTDAASGRPLLNVSGLREPELAQHVGRRVEITGAVELPRTTPVLTTAEGVVTGSIASERPPAAGVTPDGAAAHEPSDAVADSVAAARVAEPSRISDPSYFIALLPGLRAAAFRVVEGGCASPAEGASTVRAQVMPPAPAVAAAPRQQLAQRPAMERVTVRGCLVRQTPGGTALTPQQSSTDALVVADASFVSEPVDDGARGAVPGSVPSDAGSGTVPKTAATAGQAPVDAATTSFQLVMTDAQRGTLAARVGERVEITGELQPDPDARPDAPAAQAHPHPGRAQAAPADVAHVSTPTRQLTIVSFRAVGGTCH